MILNSFLHLQAFVPLKGQYVRKGHLSNPYSEQMKGGIAPHICYLLLIVAAYS